jgi:hypothetical protein
MAVETPGWSKVNNSKNTVIMLAIVSMTALFASCSDLGSSFTGDAEETEVHFSIDVQPIIQANCMTCHSASGESGGLNLSSCAPLMQGGHSGAVVVSGDSEASLIIERLRSENPSIRMPLSGPELEQTDVLIIADWIDLGAHDN